MDSSDHSTTNFLFRSEDSVKNVLLKKKIIQQLIFLGNSSIADICKMIELSVPTVTKLILDLVDDGYLVELGKQDTSGGRKPSMFGLNPNAGYFVGVEVRRRRLLLATIDFMGEMIDQEYDIPYTLENTPEALDELCTLINNYIDHLPVDRKKILYISMNLSGRINSISGYSYSYFYFSEEPLMMVLEERLGIAVNLENDSRAMAYGEYMAGVVQGEKNILHINLNWGLGSGIIIDGKLYYGKSGFSGEIGHMPVFDNEIICKCGKKGCLETEASGFAIMRMLNEKYKAGCTTILADKIDSEEGVSLYEFVDAVLKEDVLAIEIVESIGLSLGRGVAGLINLLNPELVVIGGPLSEVNDYIRLPIESAIRKYSLNLVNKDTSIKVSKLGTKAGVIGSCLLSRSKLLGLI